MTQGPYNPQLSRNPLVQIAAVVVAAFIVIGAVFLGAIVLSFFVGFAILAWVTLTVRVWWLRRSVRRGDSGRGPDRGEIVEVEYTVVEERSVDESRHRDSR
jgi:uncharacterized protein (DUF58 family)